MTRSEELKKEVRSELEKAYFALNTASNQYDLIDTVEAAKISEVRKSVLRLITTLDL